MKNKERVLGFERQIIDSYSKKAYAIDKKGIEYVIKYFYDIVSLFCTEYSSIDSKDAFITWLYNIIVKNISFNFNPDCNALNSIVNLSNTSLKYIDRSKLISKFEKDTVSSFKKDSFIKEYSKIKVIQDCIFYGNCNRYLPEYIIYKGSKEDFIKENNDIITDIPNYYSIFYKKDKHINSETCVAEDTSNNPIICSITENNKLFTINNACKKVLSLSEIKDLTFTIEYAIIDKDLINMVQLDNTYEHINYNLIFCEEKYGTVKDIEGNYLGTYKFYL